jgi:hypothetical protein
MTDTILVLGQSMPTANTLTTLYTVPAATSATISSITICNHSSTPDTFNLSIAPGGASDTPSQYIYYELYLDGNDTFIATVGFTMATTDVVRVLSLNGTSSFSLFGVQIT